MPRHLALIARVLMLSTLGAACGIPSLESGRAPQLDSEALNVRVVSGPRGPALLFQARDAGGRPVPVARLDGVRLVLEGPAGVTETLLPFLDATPEFGALSLECGPFSDHRVRIRVVLAPGDDHLQIRVEDEVALLSRIREVTLDYAFLPSDPVEESFVPHLQPEPDHVVGDASFGAPLAYLRSGTRALALVPDVLQLNRERRVPQAMEMDLLPSPRLRHGLVSYRADRAGPDGEATFFTRTDADAVVVQGEGLHFAHALHLFADAGAGTLGELATDLWLRRTDGVLGGPEVAAAVPLDRVTDEEFGIALPASWETVNLGDTSAGTIRSAGAEHLGLKGTVAWFTAARQNLRTAYGVALYAQRRDRPDLHGKVVQMVDLLLGAPRRGGLFPGVVAVDADAEQTAWVPAAASHGAIAGHYRALDSALTALWLLRLAPLVPERREVMLAACDETARFLMTNQLASGAIPAYYDPGFLAPRAGPMYEDGLESAGIALFLSHYGATRGDEEALRAGREALALLLAGLQEAGGDAETLHLAGPWHDRGDPRSGQWPRGSLGLIFAAEAALVHAGHGSFPAALQLAETLLDRLALFQQVWSPNWIGRGLAGGLGATNVDPRWSTSRQSMAAQVWLRAYRATGRRDHLRRGALALRAGLGMDSDGDLNRGRGAACTTAELGRLELGQGVVNVRGSFAEGLDALWFEDVVVDDGEVSFRLLAFEDFGPGARIVFDGLGDLQALSVVANGTALGPFTRDQLAAGARIPVRRVARVHFQPPGEIHRIEPWSPRARFEGVLAQENPAVVEVHGATGLVAELPMVLGATPGTLVCAEPFVPVGLDLGGSIRTRLVVSQGGRRQPIPAQGFREIVLGDLHCLDVGDDDEANLVDVGSSRVERFADGRENGRRLAPGHAAFTYRVPVEPEAGQLHLSIYLRGGARITCEENLLHADGPDMDPPIRELQLELGDRRLWREGGINLTFAATGGGGGPLQVAKIRYRAEGRSDLPTEVGPRETHQVIAQTMRVLVIPVDLADQPVDASAESLHQAFFGGPGYTITPAPDSRRTAGSVARMIAAMSGGLTSLEGAIADRLRVDLLAADLQGRSDGGRQLLADALADRLREAGAQGYHVVVVVHGQGAGPMTMDRQPLPAGDVRPIVVFRSERSQDGSFLPVGDLLAGILSARFGLQPMEGPESGNFGELALTASGRGHIPTGPVGVNLIRSGWVDRVVAERRNQPLVRLPILQEDRTFYVLPGIRRSPASAEILPAQGDLIIEDRRGGSGEPGLPVDGGTLLYWDFPDHRPLLIADHSASCWPRYLRVSPTHDVLQTPFKPAAAGADLFAGPISLNADSKPALFSPRGELIWSIENLRPTGDGRRSAELRYHPVHLLELGGIGWTTAGRQGRALPLPLNGPDQGLGRVTRDAGGLVLTTRPVVGGRLGAVIPLYARSDRRELDAVETLAQRLGPEQGRQARLDTIRSLQNIAVPRSRSTLREVLTDADPRVAAAARDALDVIEERLAQDPPAASPMLPLRLLGNLDWVRGGPGRLRIGIGDRAYLQSELQPDDRPAHFEVDLPAFPQGNPGALWVELESATREPVAVRLTELVAVPRQHSWHALRSPPAAPAGGERWQDGGYHSEVLSLSVPASGLAEHAAPVMLPEGGMMLRILAGLDHGAPAEQSVQVSVRLRTRDGTWTMDVVESLLLRRGEGRQPSLTALVAIPGDHPAGLVFLDVSVGGSTGSTLHFQAVELLRN